jgi:alkylation response protein AidB-like acyl-CoA dehydrogenase
MSEDYNSYPGDQFRMTVRSWIEANYPADKRFLTKRLDISEIGEWVAALASRGWLAPTWQVEHGGMGLDIRHNIIFMEEFARHGCARHPDHAINLVGPLLMHFGTPEQKAQHLSKIVAGKEIWCQGYSEPNAGSDLAQLRCAARLEGDCFVVTGQKTWSTLAHCADWIFTLVRTQKGERKQQGISILLIDLKSPGVTVRPIENFIGDVEFAEVIFDEVNVPRANLVGTMNEGWNIAKSVLGHERIMVGSPIIPMSALRQLEQLAEARGLFSDSAFIDRYAHLKLDVYDLTAIFDQFVEAAAKGGKIGAEVSLLKITATEVYQRICQEIALILGDEMRLSDRVPLADGMLDALGLYAVSRVPTIYGGANEVQRDLLAKLIAPLPA